MQDIQWMRHQDVMQFPFQRCLYFYFRYRWGEPCDPMAAPSQGRSKPHQRLRKRIFTGLRRSQHVTFTSNRRAQKNVIKCTVDYLVFISRAKSRVKIHKNSTRRRLPTIYVTQYRRPKYVEGTSNITRVKYVHFITNNINEFYLWIWRDYIECCKRRAHH